MSVKSTIVIPAAALALAGGMSAAGTLNARAATPACGISCTNLFNVAAGSGEILDAVNQVAEVGQPIDLETASGANQGEDFEVSNQGLVSDFVAAGLMDPGLGALYGGLSVYEIQWAPGGQPTGLCAGVQVTPGRRVPVTLQPCGVSVKTTWIADPVTTTGGTFDALISGATDRDFAHPSLLTATLSGSVETWPMQESHPRVNALWGMIQGVV